MRDLRETLALALPLIAGQLALFSQHLVDVVLAGHLGARVLGIVAIGTNAWGVVMMAIVGVMIPLAMVKLGRDPAIGSSVMLTACTDSGGFFIFLGLATLFLL